MNLIKKSLFAATLTAFISISAQAQHFEVSLFGSQSAVFGDFAETDLTNSSAGYVSYGMGAGLALNYYFANDFGIGFRSSGTFYQMDEEAYQSDIISQLGITGTNYAFSNALQYGFASLNTELGVSYLFNLGEKWQAEPYIYLGGVIMASPATTIVYQENDITYTQKIEAASFNGFSYAPGVRFKWNVSDHIGLNIFAEYQGKVFGESDQTSINQSFNSLDIAVAPREYTINAFALGLGLAYRFNCGKNKE
jgi:hypothetical protein